MRVDTVVLDFDGTFTDVEIEAAPFTAAYRSDLEDLLGREAQAHEVWPARIADRCRGHVSPPQGVTYRPGRRGRRHGDREVIEPARLPSGIGDRHDRYGGVEHEAQDPTRRGVGE